MRTYICIYFGAAYLAVAITPLVIWLARRIKAVDHPGIRSVHCLPIPRIGGAAIYLSTMLMLVPLLFLGNTIGERFRSQQLQVQTLLATTTMIFLIGLLDDLRGLPARFKFAVEVLGAVFLCIVGVRIGTIDLGRGVAFSLGWLACPITILWIVGITNAVNMSDGLDGLAAGIAAIACATIAGFAIHSSGIRSGPVRDNDVMMALFALTLLGSLTGFLFFNFNPAKVFMGDCGSMFIGFTIAAASVMCVAKSAALVGLALPVLALGIPIFDTLFAMLRRFLERRSLFAPDKGHFHHRLLELGLTQRRAVLIAYGTTLAAVGLGLLMMGRESLSSLAVFGAALLLIVVLFRCVGAIRLDRMLNRLQDKHRHSRNERDQQRVFEDLQLRFRQVNDGQQWREALCEAAQRMDFAWVALRTTYDDGRIEEDLWRPPNGKPDLSRVVTMTIPLKNGQTAGQSRQLEVAICVNGSLEAAGHRGTLFGRLLDETDVIAYR